MKPECDFIFDPSLVLYLPLWKLQGGAFQSEDHYGHLCTVSGALWRPDGYYFNIANTADTIQIPDADCLSLNILTFESWIKVAQEFSAFGDNATVCRKEDEYTLEIESASNELSFYIKGGGTWADASISDAGMVADMWYHIVGTYNGAVINIYKNGDLIESIAETGAITPTANVLYLGCKDNTDRWFDGTIGEIRIYNRDLTPQEVLQNYLATKDRYG